MKKFIIFAVLVTLACSSSSVGARTLDYDNSDAVVQNLPNPLMFNNGKKVKNARQWTKKRRQEILDIFSDHMFGRVPAAPEGLHFKIVSEDANVYNGIGTRRTVRIFLDAKEEHWFDMLMHLPNNGSSKVPMFAGINFWGNSKTIEGREASLWPYELILKSGFGVVTAWCNDIQEDDVEVVKGGLHEWYNTEAEWGHISKWAWALSRMLDYLETDPRVDATKVAVTGCSRLGKTALWAGANDQRFAMVISNCSGCCGAAISRRKKGETFDDIARVFPYWFVKDFQNYRGKEDEFPADQHWMAALTAPRPLYISSATEDAWADPEGEWLCAHEVGRVYALFGKHTVGDIMPSPDTPDYGGDVGYHIRTGKHGVNSYDWEQYITFARRHFGM